MAYDPNDDPELGCGCLVLTGLLLIGSFGSLAMLGAVIWMVKHL